MMILDRIDAQIAYISTDNGMLCVDRKLIAEDVQEGSVLLVHGNLYAADHAATQARQTHTRDLLSSLIRSNT